MKKIFISYNRKSRADVVTLADDLTLLGYSVWFDKELIGGHKWWDVILENIRFCEVFIFTVTQNSINATACQRELSYARALHKPIIPVLLDSTVNISLLDADLQALQFVDYTAPSKETLGKLNRALIGLPSMMSMPDLLPPTPEMPLSAVAEISQQIAQPHLSDSEQSEILNAIHQLEAPQDQAVLIKRLKQHADFSLSIPDQTDHPTPTTATLYLRRKRSYSYSMRAFQVYVDGVKIGELRNNETARFPDLAVGKHELMVKVDLSKTAISFEVSPNQQAICFDVSLSAFMNKIHMEQVAYQVLFPE